MPSTGTDGLRVAEPCHFDGYVASGNDRAGSWSGRSKSAKIISAPAFYRAIGDECACERATDTDLGGGQVAFGFLAEIACHTVHI